MNRLQVSVRPATIADTRVIVQFLRDMLSELASMGDHAMCQDQEQWARVFSETREVLDKADDLHLLAETADPCPVVVGWAYARITDLDAIYEPARVLHVSALYVSRPYRRKGIGQAMLDGILEWGRVAGCAQAELNVLVDNPARFLYEKSGFAISHSRMARKL
jgi:GNAT superfamily N-acetyltransferase